jgi:hypothetical protein
MAVNTATGVAIVGGVAIAAYFVFDAISQPTQQTGSFCNGDWTDYINPLCWISSLGAASSNTINTATNEANVILILAVVLIIAVVGLLAFGPESKHVVGGATAAFL